MYYVIENTQNLPHIASTEDLVTEEIMQGYVQPMQGYVPPSIMPETTQWMTQKPPSVLNISDGLPHTYPLHPSYIPSRMSVVS